jgi:two-component system heavy metal sensor histidine kinase CusS
MSHKSIRFRLTIWYSLALAAGLVLFGSAIWFSMRLALIRDIHAGLAAQARDLDAFINFELAKPNVDLPEEIGEYCHGLAGGTYVRVRDAAGSTIFVSNRDIPWAIPREPGIQFHRFRWRNSQYLLATANVPVNGQQWEISITGSLDAIERLLNLLRLLLVALIPGVLFAATLGGLWLSRRALRPVDDIVSVARSIGISNLSERLPVPNSGDELQRLSEAWNSMLSRLEGAVKRLSRFTADAAHELRTPLGVIRTTAELAARKNRSADSYRQALEQITAESERMTALLDDLLFLARCDSESIEMPMSPLELCALVAESCQRMMPLAESRAVRLILDLGDNSCWTLGNQLALRRLVFVLLDNAIKYSDPGKKVFVRLRREGDELCFEVEDQGRGITPADLPHVFERFYRSHKTRDTKEYGYGLGLSLASGIAERHQARIDVETVPAQGSIFRVVFRDLRECVKANANATPREAAEKSVL